MKTMTCKQMGGPCEAQIHGNTPDEMVANGAMHVNQMVESGDTIHNDAKKMMDDAQKNPELAAAWFAKFSADYAALPETI